MRITASVKSRLMRRGSEKRIAALLSKMSKEPIDSDIRDMVGKLELNAERPDDFFLLRELRAVLVGKDWGGGGRIIIYDKTGKKVEDWLSVVNDGCECKGKTHNRVCSLRWKKENEKKKAEASDG